jgi:hypothetical protein
MVASDRRGSARDDTSSPVLSLDHQPGINLVVSVNRNPLLIPVREQDDCVPRHCRHRTSLGWLTLIIALWVEAEHYKVGGACLAAARRRANVTQDELAARLGKPQSFVSEYERGQRRVDVVELLVISRALGVDPVDLFREILKATGSG